MYTHGFNRFCVIGGEPENFPQLLSMKNQVLPQMWQAQVCGAFVCRVADVQDMGLSEHGGYKYDIPSGYLT